MVKVITQETFNDAVKENMSLFGLEGAEAIRETVDQFRSQGVDLSNIIKEEWSVLGGEDPLSDAIAKLSLDSPFKNASIKSLIDLCRKDISIRLKAADLGAYPKVVEVLKSTKETDDILLCLDALNALTEGFPDLLENDGMDIIFKFLQESEEEMIISKTLDWTKQCCLKHEKNRKAFIDRNIPDILKTVTERFTNTQIVIATCGLTAALTLDDDIRESVSGSHIHACTLAKTLLSVFVSQLRVHNDNEVVAQILRTLATLLVRDTLCQQFVDLGGLEELLRILHTGPNQKVLRYGFNVLACLAGHDDIKDSIVKSGLGPLIATSLWRGQDSAPLCTSGLSLVARLCLRSAGNSRSLYNVGLGDCIAHIMKTHCNEEKLQGAGCLAIRNMVSHCPDLRAGLLSLGLEKTLEQLPKRFPNLSDNSKATLLALDCKVHLKEEWTGLHGDKLKEHSV